MEIFRDYGVGFTFVAPIIKAGTDDFAVSGDWTPATGDVMISKDGAAFSNIGTLPSAATAGWLWTVSATEAECYFGAIRVVDSATKAVKDQFFMFRTLPPGAIAVFKVSAATANTITFPNVAPFNTWADNQPNGCAVVIHGGTGKNQGSPSIQSFVASTRVATLDRSLAITLDGTSVGVIYPQAVQGTTPESLVLADARRMNGATIQGDGTSGNLWRG
jgi:hypothetical protein